MPQTPTARRIAVAAAVVGVALAAVAIMVSHVNRRLSEARSTVANAGHLPFTLRPLPPPANPGFERVATPLNFVSAAALDGHVFLDGAGGLDEFTANGVRIRSLRTGAELPPVALGQSLTAHLRGEAAPDLVIATTGAGVLLLSSGDTPIRQMLPDDADARDVTAIAALPSGELLLGTRRHGLLVYDGQTLQVYRPELDHLSITSLLTAGNDLWTGTQDHGLFRTHAGVTEHFDSVLPDTHIEALAGDADRVFAATPVGVAEFDGGRFARTVADGVFSHALFVSDGSHGTTTLTLAPLFGGAVDVSLSASTNAARHPITAPASSAPEGADGAPIAQLLQLPGDSALYAVRADGLYRRHGADWLAAVAAEPATLTDANIAALAFAPDGKLWVGSFDHGLDLLELSSSGGESTKPAQHIEDDHLFCINRIALDPQRQTMAVATANGLVLFDSAGKPRQVLTRRDGLIADHINDVVYSGNRMTVATPAGLTFVDDTGVASLYAFQGLVNNHVYALAVSADGNDLLAGTLGGVSLLRAESVRQNLTVANSALRHNWITAAVALPAGMQSAPSGYFVGTYGAGVMQLDSKGRFHPLEGATRNMVVNPNAMLVTTTHIYAGTLDQGLWSFSRANNRWAQITTGLPSLNVTALAARDGRLFVGTENGLVSIDEARLPQ